MASTTAPKALRLRCNKCNAVVIVNRGGTIPGTCTCGAGLTYEKEIIAPHIIGYLKAGQPPVVFI